MIATLVPFLLVLVALSLHSLLVAAVVAGVWRRRFDRAFEAGRDAERLRPTLGNVRRIS